MIKGVLNMKKSIKQKIIVLMAVSAMALSACAKSDTSTPDSSKTETTDTASDAADINAEDEEKLISVLVDIRDNMEVGTAGSSLKAVPFGAELLDWSIDTTMNAHETKQVVAEWLSEQDSDKLAEINEQLMLAGNTAVALIGESGKELMESAGFESENYPWTDAKTDIINSVMNGVGSEGSEERPSDNTEAWKTDFEKSLMDNYGYSVDHYEDLGDGIYQAYVEIDGQVVPYVTVDSATGEYHG